MPKKKVVKKIATRKKVQRKLKVTSGEELLEATPEVEEPNHRLDAMFPKLAYRQYRTLYFRSLPPADLEVLKKRGYRPVYLATMPVGTEEEKQAYLKAYGQAMLDGTLEIEKDAANILRLLFKEAGLIENKARDRGDSGKSVNSENLEILLNWGPSRHTVDQSTLKYRKKKAKLQEDEDDAI